MERCFLYLFGFLLACYWLPRLNGLTWGFVVAFYGIGSIITGVFLFFSVFPVFFQRLLACDDRSLLFISHQPVVVFIFIW